jgi:stearoyl-CoA desaturase (delta-9 desaturase)
VTTPTAPERNRVAAKPMLDGQRPPAERLVVGIFTAIPMLALIAAVPLAWGWGLSWTDIGLAAGFYLISGLGVTIGFHRYFTHRAFKANRGLRNGLAIAGSMPCRAM